MSDEIEERDDEREAAAPKPRKHMVLWQSYQYWWELVEFRKRHVLRISAAERQVSNLDAEFERQVLEHMGLDKLIKDAKKMMVNYGETVGPIWQWLTSIRGLGEGGLAAQLLAQIDDIGKFDTISKLWMFAGYGLANGQVVRNAKGEKSHYNRMLKSIVWQCADQFKRQRTFPYRDLYDEEKIKQRAAHPVALCRNEDIPWTECLWKKEHKQEFNDGHIDMRALRKTGKIFLAHVWLKWRESEGLPVSQPYVQAILGHTHIVEPG